MSLTFLALLAAFAVAQNIDNLIIAAAYRIKGVLIPARQNAIIALVSAVATGIAVTAGWVLGEKARQSGWQNAEWVGRGLLVMLGIWSLVGYLWKKVFRQLDQADVPESSAPIEGEIVIRQVELMVAAVALAIDNLAPSFAFGVTQVGKIYSFIPMLILAILLSSVALVQTGQFLGSRGKVFFGPRGLRLISPEVVFGIMIMCIAVFDRS